MRTINGTKADDLVYGQGLTSRQRWVIPLWLSTLAITCKALVRAVRWFVVHSSLTLPPLVLAVAVARFGWLTVTLAGLGVAAVLVGWWYRHPSSLVWLVGPVWSLLLGTWRSVVRYRRLWRAGMLGAGLAATSPSGGDLLPILKRVRSTWWVDTVTARLLHGQTPDQFARAAEALRHTFAAHRCVVREVEPGTVCLRFYGRDPLTKPLPPFPIPPTTAGPGGADLARLPVAVTEDGLPFTLRLLGTHVLVAGASGSGKGSVLWSTLRALVPLVRDGSVQVWAIDPKGGMELVLGRPLFARYEDTDLAAMAVVLEDAVTAMDERTQRLKGITRQHTPTPADPYVVILIDEVASLTAYCADRDIKRRIQQALSLLLSKGRAPGYSVIAALQDPRKDVLPFRDLFPTRIALRLSEPEQVDMVLGDSARERGARCHDIPLSLPGVGYLVREDHPAPVRARFTWLSDDDIVAMSWPLDGPDPESTDDQDGRDEQGRWAA